jgi:hypothetical protein
VCIDYIFIYILLLTQYNYWSQDSSVGIVKASGWMAQVQFLVVQDFSLFHSVQTDCGAHPASYPMIQWVPGVLSPGVKQEGHVADRHLHLVPRSRKLELYLHFSIYEYFMA